MSVFVPLEPKIYHIVHVDRLPSILRDGALYSDAVMRERGSSGTAIGYEHIKEARLKRALWTYPDLMVGECVPFYFCPRSPMLHKVTRYPHDLNYDGGDGPILHLESDMRAAIAWASKAGRRWVFTDVSAATAYFKDYSDLSELNRVDWDAVTAWEWSTRSAQKQAEFLVEREFAWSNVGRIGCRNWDALTAVQALIERAEHRPSVAIIPRWYYA